MQTIAVKKDAIYPALVLPGSKIFRTTTPTPAIKTAIYAEPIDEA